MRGKNRRTLYSIMRLKKGVSFLLVLLLSVALLTSCLDPGDVNEDIEDTEDSGTTTTNNQDATLDLPTFVDNSDGTVSDNVNNLMWQKCTDGLSGTNCISGVVETYNWYEASNTFDLSENFLDTGVCDELELATHVDWRLPNKNELLSIVDDQKSSPAIDTVFFPNTVSSYYWSLNYEGDTAWVLDFVDGAASSIDKTLDYYVRCVRDQ